MASRDLVNNISVATSLAPAVRTDSANGTSVDLAGYASAAVVVVTGTITDGTHTIEVQESDNNTTWNPVADADLQGTEPDIGSANSNSVYEIGYIGTKRYLRVVVTVTGATSGGNYTAFVVRGHNRKVPV